MLGVWTPKTFFLGGGGLGGWVRVWFFNLKVLCVEGGLRDCV